MKGETCLLRFSSFVSGFDAVLSGFGRVVLETDPTVVVNRVAMRGADSDVPLAEQSLSQVMAAAREQMTRALLK